jgi:hypothetical protein
VSFVTCITSEKGFGHGGKNRSFLGSCHPVSLFACVAALERPERAEPRSGVTPQTRINGRSTQPSLSPVFGKSFRCGELRFLCLTQKITGGLCSPWVRNSKAEIFTARQKTGRFLSLLPRRAERLGDPPMESPQVADPSVRAVPSKGLVKLRYATARNKLT